MFKWLSKRREKKRGHAKQPGADQLYSSIPGSAGAASTSDAPHRTSTASSPGPSLEYSITQTGTAHTSLSSPEVNTVIAQYDTTHDLQTPLHRSHPTVSTTEHRHPLTLSAMAEQHQPPIPSTGRSFSTAQMPIPRQDRSSSEPGIQFEGTNMRAIAGGDIASKNILQQGDGNQIYIHGTGETDEHEVLLRRIEKKLGSYVASDATLSKDVHGDPSVCYQGTREDLLEHVLSWVEGSPARTKENVDDIASRALCIVGAPGSGKSTIMNTLILNLLRNATRRSPGLISAHYCIRRSLQSTTDSSKVLPTLILQLARRDLGIAKGVSTLLDEALLTEVITPQLQEEVFLGAISAYNRIVFVIIDALDEASRPAILAEMLSRVISKSPPHLRLLLATRNEHGVLQGLGKDLIPDIVYEIPTEESLNEVGAYIAHRLRDGVERLFEDDPAWRFWPYDSQLRSLSDKAGGLFVWARTAVDFILSRIEKQGEVERDGLIEDIGRDGMADVNMLYMFILRRSLREEGVDHKKGTSLESIRGVLGFITAAEKPLPLDDIIGFLDFKGFDVRNFVRLARSILVPGVEKIAGATIPQIHKTFFDFLTSNRAEEFQIEVEDVHRAAARRCFDLMDSELRFNICRLRSSFQLNKGLDDLITSLPKGLIYASTSWWYHLKSTRGDSESQLLLRSYLHSIKTLLHEKFLFWLEIVTLFKKADDSASWLEELADQLEHSKLVVDGVGLSVFANDASLLIKKFSKCMGASIPHIYISLLAFSPKGSIVATHYRKRSATIVIPCAPGMPPRWDSWDADPKMTDLGSVDSVSFSPCGRRLAAGYSVNTIRVWDIETGECVIGPLKGHSGSVKSVCFSPSGLLIASGSGDKTIRVWDAETGKCMLGPLTGHTRSVKSVSFSPDGTRIASSSWDRTILVWDVRTGDCVLGLFERHSGSIHTVSYSPDGSIIASDCNDSTIRLWNAQTGECIPGPLVGHKDFIYSLSFHPDGRRLVSGSSDHDLRLWDIQEGTCTHDPLTGHTDAVWSVCFSPDGRYIASGSKDRTIRIWDAGTAECVAGPFGGASGAVRSVAFSPDGRYLAAGSEDRIVRLWDFKALLSVGLHDSACEGQASTELEITDHTVDKDEHVHPVKGSWTMGPNGEHLFWAPTPYDSAIWRPSTVRILGRPSMIKPDSSNLVTGEEWLSCFPSS